MLKSHICNLIGKKYSYNCNPSSRVDGYDGLVVYDTGEERCRDGGSHYWAASTSWTPWTCSSAYPTLCPLPGNGGRIDETCNKPLLYIPLIIKIL